jgi:hypothetical protein
MHNYIAPRCHFQAVLIDDDVIDVHIDDDAILPNLPVSAQDAGFLFFF